MKSFVLILLVSVAAATLTFPATFSAEFTTSNSYATKPTQVSTFTWFIFNIDTQRRQGYLRVSPDAVFSSHPIGYNDPTSWFKTNKTVYLFGTDDNSKAETCYTRNENSGDDLNVFGFFKDAK